MDFIDYYEVMGVRPEAPADEIKRAYRKLARKYHPDVSTEDDAGERFKAVGEAWAVLKDPERRREYDELRTYRARAGAGAGAEGFGPPPGRRGAGAGGGTGPWHGDGGADFSDFFRDIFGEAAARGQGGFGGGPRAGGAGGFDTNMPLKGEDVHGTLAISLQDAHDGARLPLTLRVPVHAGDGSVGFEEKTLQVRIPTGVTSGRRIRLRGQGAAGLNGGEAGDLYVEIRLEEDPRFALEGRDVTHVLSVSPWEAALGAALPVPTLGGEVRLNVPPRSSGGRRLRLKGRGLAGDPPGDQFVVLKVSLPQPDDDEQRALYERMRELWPDHDPRADAGPSARPGGNA